MKDEEFLKMKDEEFLRGFTFNGNQ